MHVLLLPPLLVLALLLGSPLLLLLSEHRRVPRRVLVLGLGQRPLVATTANPTHQLGAVVSAIERSLLLALVTRLWRSVTLKSTVN